MTFITTTAIHKHSTGHHRFACFRRFLHSSVRDISEKKGKKKNNKVTANSIASFYLTEEGRRKEGEEREKEGRAYASVASLLYSTSYIL
jgi:hypothetical protein